ncbi:MAG: glycosyl hydrolase [Asticcacaulis sp.]|uniref:glycosyl hydrolase n=1 Tax=Asticcacaulis sp. TaxID=1872648 RepID=UPI003F7B966D
MSGGATHALLLGCALAACSGACPAQDLRAEFMAPHDAARPIVRWWWFGPAVQADELKREIAAMKAGGFGGFEIQPVYPLKTQGNLPYLSDDFLKMVGVADQAGLAAGLRVDVTLGSGWPYGGPNTSPDQASAHIRKLIEDASQPLPALSPGERFIAGFVGADEKSARLVSLDHTIATQPGDKLFLFIQSPTQQQVKRAAVGAEGLVLDHMNKTAVEHHLSAVADRLMTAFDAPPYSVFSDSLEVYGADWTGDLLAQFQKRRGYDLTPHLFELFDDSPETENVRHDWALTLSELTDERYLNTIEDWAKAHDTKFRAQVYGTPPVSLSSNALVDLPEGEGAHWRQFSTARWASSANHIYHRPVTSAESWTWVHTTPFRATPLDIKAEADVLMLEGINQFVAHGWPYSPPDAGEPGWSFYAAGVFNDHNPWWGVMPDLNQYLTRMSWLLRQGDNVADVALYLPEDDALAATTPGKATINGRMDKWITPELTISLLDSGYNFDYVDAGAIAAKGVGHKILILPAVERLSPQTCAALQAYAAQGGHVIALDRLPNQGTGLLNAAQDAAAVQACAHDLFPNGAVALADLPAALQGVGAPDAAGLPSGVGYVHRRLGQADVYFVANTTNQSVAFTPVFRAANIAQAWNPVTGAEQAASGVLTLAPYESRVFATGEGEAPPTTKQTLTLKAGWTLRAPDGKAQPVTGFGSWTRDPALARFSGALTYSRTLRLTPAQARAHVALDFGAGQPVPPPRRAMGSQALIDPPVREAAEIFVNGRRVGAVWTSPFTLDLSGYVTAGDNRLEVRVSNTAINELSGRPTPDYAPLIARYGERFSPQGINNLAPLPSGLMTAPKLEIAP